MGEDWFVLEVADGVDLGRPGIYEWRIEGVGSYVGKSKRLPRRLREYPNNVRKLIEGLPYRRGKPAEYRAVHHALRLAREEGRQVIVRIIENCEATALSDRERYWIGQLGTLNR